jgi:hypothetical protein
MAGVEDPVIRFLVKALVFLFIKLPLMLLVGLIKLVFLPFQLVALLFKAIGLLKYVVIGALLVAVAKRVLGALEARGARTPA